MSNDAGFGRDALIAGGFLPTTYKGQEGEFLVKRMPIERMPEAGARLVDEDLIQSGMDAITEICPDGTVQLYIPDCDVLDDRQPVDSNAGRAMIADAIAAAADSMPHKRVSIIAPKESTERYRSGWERGDAFAVSGGELKADGPTDYDQETWEGFVDALSAHRAATT